MSLPSSPTVQRPRVGYVVKRYPRFSETFIVNEILAHEATGLEIDIFSLLPSNDEHFQYRIARVRAPVKYLPGGTLKAADVWNAMTQAAAADLEFWSKLHFAVGEEAHIVHQAMVLARYVRARGIGHLHAHFATDAAAVARLAARFANVPYTITAHAKDIFHESVEPDDLRRKCSDAAAVITVSDFNLAYLREHYGAAARIERIYNGLDLDLFPYAAPLQRPPRIVAVGRLVEKKGFDDLIDACALLAAQHREFSCQIVGGGELAGQLRKHVEQRGMQSHIELLGSRPQEEVIRLLQGAAVFAAPCIVGEDGNRDGLPTVLLEAMALGVPCISTDVTGIPEIIHHEQTGLMVPQRNPEALAAACERLLANPDLRVRLADQARKLIEVEFDIHRNAAQIRELFGNCRGNGLTEASMITQEAN